MDPPALPWGHQAPSTATPASQEQQPSQEEPAAKPLGLPLQEVGLSMSKKIQVRWELNVEVEAADGTKESQHSTKVSGSLWLTAKRSALKVDGHSDCFRDSCSCAQHHFPTPSTTQWWPATVIGPAAGSEGGEQTENAPAPQPNAFNLEYDQFETFQSEWSTVLFTSPRES